MNPVRKYENNPVLSAGDITYPASLIFNAGVCKFQGKYIMLFRDDVGYSKEGKTLPKPYTCLGIAVSDDGIRWTPWKDIWSPIQQIIDSDPEYYKAYDPRLTVLDGRCYICFALDTWHGTRGGIAVTDDFEKIELLSLSLPDNRNMVLFPEKFNGRFVRLERPFPVYSTGGENFDIWISASADCRFWGDFKLLLKHEQVPFANSKIGPAAPPVKTDRGWLTLFHAVHSGADKELDGWEIQDNPKSVWKKEYLAGIMLLDLEDPSKVLAVADRPLIQAEEPYEINGFRGSVIFPGGMILEDSGEVKIYYGAADTVECLATAHVDDLIRFCCQKG